eukprot:PhF_6_TR28095/c2_g1_i2/m.41531
MAYTSLLCLVTLLVGISHVAADPLWIGYVNYDCNLNNGHDLSSMSGTLAQCQTWCNNNALCTGFDYYPNSNLCFFSQENCMDSQNTAWTFNSGCTYYGRTAPSVSSSSGQAVTCVEPSTAYYGGSVTTFTCPSGCTAQVSGLVSGSGPYTMYSSMCGAAIHSGVITDAGGLITVTWTGSNPVFTSTTAHGITSQPSTFLPASFSFGPYTPPPYTCSDINLWVPEGVKLAGD